MVCQALQSCIDIQELDLSQSILDQDALIEMFEGIKDFESVKNLILNNNKLENEAILRLATMISSNHCIQR
jgi:Ran GTPase-activating protein (RanGAP) involved in mRNA processing and transport